MRWGASCCVVPRYIKMITEEVSFNGLRGGCIFCVDVSNVFLGGVGNGGGETSEEKRLKVFEEVDE